MFYSYSDFFFGIIKKIFKELINYYKGHNLRESFETLDTILGEHYSPNQPYKAIHNFEAANSNFLELKTGQIVYVISRTGEERGWWKGKSGDRVSFSSVSFLLRRHTFK